MFRQFMSAAQALRRTEHNQHAPSGESWKALVQSRPYLGRSGVSLRLPAPADTGSGADFTGLCAEANPAIEREGFVDACRAGEGEGVSAIIEAPVCREREVLARLQTANARHGEREGHTITVDLDLIGLAPDRRLQCTKVHLQRGDISLDRHDGVGIRRKGRFMKIQIARYLVRVF